MSTSTLSAVDANTGNKIPLATFDDANGNTVVGHVVLAGTPLVPVAPGNPLSVADSVAEAALTTLGTNTAATMTAAGTPADAAWGGSGAGTLVALLKALYGELAGTLTTTIAGVTVVSGASAIGTTPANPPLSVSGVDAQGLKRHFLTDGNGVVQVAQTAPLPAGTNTIGSVTVSGTPTVTVGNLPATQPVSGTVTVNQGGAPWSMSLAAGATVGITGTPTVSVSNFPASQAVSGTVNVGNLPVMQAVSGTVALGAGSQAIGTVGVTGTVAVADASAETALVSITTNTAGTMAATGTPGDAAWTGTGSGSLVALIKALYAKLAGTLTTTITGALPAGTNTLGSVSVSNLPVTQSVSGTVALAAGATVGITGIPAVSVSNFPASQAVSGTVNVGNLPATQPVSGTVTLGAGSQAIGTVGVTGTVAVADSAAAASLATIATNTAVPAARVLVSRSVASTVASVSTTLVAANAARRLLRVQAPQGAGVWLNLLGGTAGANAPDCLYLATGDVFEGQETNAVTYWCATGGLILSAWEA